MRRRGSRPRVNGQGGRRGCRGGTKRLRRATRGRARWRGWLGLVAENTAVNGRQEERRDRARECRRWRIRRRRISPSRSGGGARLRRRRAVRYRWRLAWTATRRRVSAVLRRRGRRGCWARSRRRAARRMRRRWCERPALDVSSERRMGGCDWINRRRQRGSCLSRLRAIPRRWRRPSPSNHPARHGPIGRGRSTPSRRRRRGEGTAVRRSGRG